VKLARAQVIADLVQGQLATLCVQLQVAGSIRRRRPEVGDLDLVLLPRPGQAEAIKARCRQKCAVVREGEQNCIYRLPASPEQALREPPELGWQIDLFFARPTQRDLLGEEPGNFGSLLLCRTGSKEHNIFLIEHAKALDEGLTWNPYRGVVNQKGQVIASETEEAIFTALKLPFVRPEDRERR